MAAETRQQQSKKRTDWRVLAGLGILALIAVSLLLIREEYPSPPKPVPPKLPTTLEQKQPPQVAVPEAAKDPKEQKSLSLEPTPSTANGAQQPPASNPSPAPQTMPNKTASAAAETPAPQTVPEAAQEPAPSLELPPSSQTPEPVAIAQEAEKLESEPAQKAAPEAAEPEAAAPEAAGPEAVSEEQDTPADPAMRADVGQQQAEPSQAPSAPEAASPDTGPAQTLVAEAGSSELAATPAYVCRFAFDADTLSALEQQKLHDFLNSLGPNVASLRLEGHADSIGPESYNMALSKNRAAYVAALTAAITGFDASRIQTKGWGENRPSVANISPTHRAENRRVAVYVTQGPEPPTLVQQQLGPLRQMPEGAVPRPRKGDALPLAAQAKAGQTALSRPIAADVEAGMQPAGRPRSEAPEQESEPTVTLVRKQAHDFSGNYFSLLEQCPVHVLHFGFDSAHVSPGAAKELSQALSSLPPGAVLTLAAHTDKVGSQAYNLDLARRRALAVAKVLMRELDEPPAIRILLLSEDYPFCPPPPGAPVPLRCNRRVEVFVQQEPDTGASHDTNGATALLPPTSSDALRNNFTKTAGRLHNPLALKGAGV